jgi:hypothetical protein
MSSACLSLHALITSFVAHAVLPLARRSANRETTSTRFVEATYSGPRHANERPSVDLNGSFLLELSAGQRIMPAALPTGTKRWPAIITRNN